MVVTDGDGDGETRREDEEDPSDFFDAGEGAVISPDRLPLVTRNLRQRSKWRQRLAPKTVPSVPYMCVVLSSGLRKKSYTHTGRVKGAVRCIP